MNEAAIFNLAPIAGLLNGATAVANIATQMKLDSLALDEFPDMPAVIELKACVERMASLAHVVRQLCKARIMDMAKIIQTDLRDLHLSNQPPDKLGLTSPK